MPQKMQKKSGSTLLSYTEDDDLIISIRRHEATRTHLDILIGKKNDDLCPDFYTTSKEGRSIEGLVNKRKKEWVRDGGLHKCSMLKLPIGYSDTIPKGHYGAGKWEVVAKGSVKRKGNRKSFKIDLQKPSDVENIECGLYAPWGPDSSWALTCTQT